MTNQRLDPSSLLTWFERTLHARRECEEIGSGDHEVIDAGPDHVMVHRRDPEQNSLNFVADSDYGNDNFGSHRVPLALGDDAQGPACRSNGPARLELADVLMCAASQRGHACL